MRGHNEKKFGIAFHPDQLLSGYHYLGTIASKQSSGQARF